MKGAPPTKHEQLSLIDQIVQSVDQKGREMNDRWGFGRLPLLVPIAMAESFRRQRLKFSGAVWEYDLDAVHKHGEAMLRAYAKLDELAVAAGAKPVPPEQWEFDTPDGLVVLVKDLRDVSRARLDGRQGQVWSLDEVASVIRAHPVLMAAKNAFPGAEVEDIRPPLDLKRSLNDSLEGIPV